MTYLANETSIEGGQPIDIFEIRLDAEVFRYTSNDSDLTVQANLYEAIPIQRSGVKHTADQDQDRLIVTLPGTNPFVQKYVLSVPGRGAVLTVKQFHRADADAQLVTVFKGIIRSVAFQQNGRVAELQAWPIASAKSRIIPRHTYQGLCNHMLYDARCKISESDPAFEKFLAVSAVSGSNITVPGAGAFGADFFEAGFVEFQDDFRAVTDQATDVLTLLIPFAVSPLGQTVRLLAGCKHRLQQDCVNKFQNAINFGGFPFVPQKNIFQTGLD